MYRIVYLALNSEKFELNRFLKEMPNDEMCNQLVQRGIDFKSTLLQGNIKKIFDLYKHCNLELLRKVISMFLPKLRIWALQIMCKSFGPKIKVEFIQEFLVFDSAEECLEF